MRKGFISIIVPLYYAVPYMDACISSIVKQTYDKLEIILVDDGSPDASGKKAEDWAKKDPRIRVIHQENKGASAARNTGLDAATGEYIGFADHDDYLVPDMYELLYRNRVEEGTTCCGYFSVTGKTALENPGFEGEFSPEEAVGIYLEDEIQKANGHRRLRMGAYLWCKMFHYKVFSGVRLPVGKLYEDTMVIMDLLLRSRSVKFVAPCKYYYVYHPESNHHTMRNHYDLIGALKHQENLIREHHLPYEKEISLLLTIAYIQMLHETALLPDRKTEELRRIRKESKEELRKRLHTGVQLSWKFRLKYILKCYFPWLFRLLYAVRERLR